MKGVKICEIQTRMPGTQVMSPLLPSPVAYAYEFQHDYES
jgi:hypothetical protein